MNSKFSVILQYTSLNNEFIDVLSGVLKQSVKDFEVIILYDNISDITRLKSFLGNGGKIKFYNENSRKNILTLLDSEYLFFCDEHNILQDNALDLLYKIAQKSSKDILMYNGRGKHINSDNIFEYSDLGAHNILFNTTFIKNRELSLKDLMDVSSPLAMLKVISAAEVGVVDYNPYKEYMDFRKNKLFDWKRYLTSLDEFYKYIVENNLDNQYLKQFSDFFLKYVYDLFCFKSDKELNQIIKFIESKIPSFMSIIKTEPMRAQYEIFDKYFIKRKKQQTTAFLNEINIATFCDEGNAAFLAVSLISMINQTSKNNMYNIYVLHKGLSAEVIRKLYSLSKVNVNILFLDIISYMKNFNIDTDNIELIIPKIFCNLENVIYIRNNILFKFDINDFWEKSISTNYVTGVSEDGEILNLQNILLFFFNIKECLKDRISEQLFLFCSQDANAGNYIGNYIKKGEGVYDFVYLDKGKITDDNIDDCRMIEWLNYSRKTAYYEWFLYSLFEKGMQNGQ